MILQKLAAAIRRQDWFQVVIEVLIVIVGIFLGLQVQAWYEDRAERRLEHEYLLKLHDDADRLIDSAADFTLVSQEITNNLKSLTLKLLDNVESPSITKRECNSLGYSHIYVTRMVSLATLDELQASGQILLIRNEEIRRLISEFNLRTQTTTMLLNSLQADKLDLPRVYPEIIKLKSLQAGNQESFYEIDTECNFELMIENDLFINQLIGNSARHRAYVESMFFQLEVLQLLHDEIARELSIIHERDAL